MSDVTLRTTHVGSLPRPARLRSLLDDPTVPRTDVYEREVDSAIRRAVRMQTDAGIDVINDGEQGRISYSVDVTTRLDGFSDGIRERERPSDLDEYPEYAGELLSDAENIGGPVATGPIRYDGVERLRDELTRFDRAVDAEEITYESRFHTAPSPGAVLRFAGTEFHDTEDAFLFELADALRTEYETILGAGATLQIDAPELLAGFTLSHKQASVSAFREQMGTYVEAINRAVGSLPADRIRLHACYGNYPGPHHHDVELVEVIDRLYEADVGGLVVEAANPRHQHEHRTFEEQPLPDGWTLVPGVIDVKTNVVEHPEVVADRLERFADAVGDPSRLVAGTDCGFETVVGGANSVHETLVPKKLEALVEGAKLAEDRLS